MGSALPRTVAPAPAGPRLSAQRCEILQWLERSAPPLAELYQTTVMLFIEVRVPSRARMVAHGVREICNHLPRYFVEISKDQVPYRDMTEKLLRAWRGSNLRVGVVPFPDVADVGVQRAPQLVSSEIFDQIAELLAEHERGSLRVRDRVTLMFIALQKAEGASEAQVMPAVARWMDVYNWFVKIAHRECRDDDVATVEFKENFERFERLLHTLTGRFFDVVEDIDAILAETNA
jgi:hypothetical protein